MSFQQLVRLSSIPFYIVFLSVTSCTPKPKEQINHYGTGEVSRRYFEIEGKKEGKMTDYYLNGAIQAERVFENDKQVGKTQLFYPSGAIKEVQYYSNGLKQGGDTVWYENKQAQFVLEYKDGKRNGYLRKWSPEGVLVYEARFEMDSLVEVQGKSIQKKLE